MNLARTTARMRGLRITVYQQPDRITPHDRAYYRLQSTLGSILPHPRVFHALGAKSPFNAHGHRLVDWRGLPAFRR